MAETTTKRCRARRWRGYSDYACGKPAKYVNADGQPACYPHSDEGITKRRAKSFARDKAQQRIRDAEAAVLNAESAIVAAVMAAHIGTLPGAVGDAAARLAGAQLALKEVRGG